MIKKLAAAGLTALAAVTLTPAPVSAAAPTEAIAALLDRVVPEQLTQYQIPGAAVVVVAEGRQVLAKGFGVADVARQTPIDPAGTGFFTGSIGKLFTATAIRALVADRRLDLDADVNRYLSTFQVADSYPGQPITLRHLLTYTAGFDERSLGIAVPTAVNAPALGGWLADNQPARVRPPGTVASYDNYGVALAGYIVEQVTGQPFAEHLDATLFAPLGMTGTSAAQPHPARITSALATGYRVDGGRQIPALGQYSAMVPAGPGMVTVPVDIGRYMLAELAPGNVALQRQFTPERRLPGLGFLYEEHPRGGQRVLTKDGDVPGYHGNLALLPDRGIGIYVVYNGDGANGAAVFAGHDLVSKVIDEMYPAPPSPQTQSAGDLSQYAGTYRTTRHSHHDFTKFATLMSPVTVAVDGDGLSVSGLSDNPDVTSQHWTPIGPGLFADRSGQERLAFHDGALYSTIPNASTVRFERLAWYSTPAVQLALIGASLLILFLGLIGWPIAMLIRRLRRRPRTDPGWPVLVGWLTAVAAVGFFILLGTVLSDASRLAETILLNDSGLLTATLFLPYGVVLGAAVMLIATVLAWTRRWWRLPGRIGYSLSSAAALGFVTFAAASNLIGV